VSAQESDSKLPKDIQHYLATLAKIYKKDKEQILQKIIVNAEVQVHEGWTYDNWNGGMDGHALFLTIPESLYIDIVNYRDAMQSRIRNDLNKIHNIPDEFISDVFIKMKSTNEHNWRKESGLLMDGRRVIMPDAVAHIWGDQGYYRVFLSHKTEFKEEAAALKEELSIYGISSFVAHEDIHPTKEWQDEIEKALFSMGALVALMTNEFHDSLWTDQEVGVAFGREVPIISVKLGIDPYGFIGKFQALSCSWNKLAKEIVKILIKQNRMLSAYIKAVQNCRSFDYGNTLSKILPSIDKLSDQQANDLISAFNENSEVRGSFGFNGRKPRFYGDGLVHHLNRLTGRTYRYSTSGEIEEVL